MLVKREQTQTLNFFRVITCLSVGSRSLTPPLKRPLLLKKIRARKLSSPYIFVAGVLRLYLITFRRQLPKGHESSPHICQSCQREGHRLPFSPRMCTQCLKFQSSLVIFNYHECLDLPIRKPLCALLVYLFIDWLIQFQFFYKPFNYVKDVGYPDGRIIRSFQAADLKKNFAGTHVIPNNNKLRNFFFAFCRI